MKSLKDFLLNEKSFSDMVTDWFEMQFHFKEYQYALKTLKDIFSKLNDEEKKAHSVSFYAQKVAARYRNVSGEMLANMYQDIVPESFEDVEVIKNYLNEKDPCWKGYKQLGTKEKDGKEVPNCVPEKEEEENERS